MADPKNIGEANIAMDGFKAIVSDQIAELRKYLYWVLGLLLVGLAGGIAIMKQVSDVQIEAQKQGGEVRIEILKQGGDLRTELQKQIGDLRVEQQKQIGDVRTDVALANQTIGRIEKTVGDLQITQGQALARVESHHTGGLLRWFPSLKHWGKSPADMSRQIWARLYGIPSALTPRKLTTSLPVIA